MKITTNIINRIIELIEHNTSNSEIVREINYEKKVNFSIQNIEDVRPIVLYSKQIPKLSNVDFFIFTNIKYNKSIENEILINIINNNLSVFNEDEEITQNLIKNRIKKHIYRLDEIYRVILFFKLNNTKNSLFEIKNYVKNNFVGDGNPKVDLEKTLKKDLKSFFLYEYPDLFYCANFELISTLFGCINELKFNYENLFNSISISTLNHISFSETKENVDTLNEKNPPASSFREMIINVLNTYDKAPKSKEQIINLVYNKYKVILDKDNVRSFLLTDMNDVIRYHNKTSFYSLKDKNGIIENVSHTRNTDQVINSKLNDHQINNTSMFLFVKSNINKMIKALQSYTLTKTSNIDSYLYEPNNDILDFDINSLEHEVKLKQLLESNIEFINKIKSLFFYENLKKINNLDLLQKDIDFQFSNNEIQFYTNIFNDIFQIDKNNLVIINQQLFNLTKDEIEFLFEAYENLNFELENKRESYQTKEIEPSIAETKIDKTTSNRIPVINNLDLKNENDSKKHITDFQIDIDHFIRRQLKSIDDSLEPKCNCFIKVIENTLPSISFSNNSEIEDSIHSLKRRIINHLRILAEIDLIFELFESKKEPQNIFEINKHIKGNYIQGKPKVAVYENIKSNLTDFFDLNKENVIYDSLPHLKVGRQDLKSLIKAYKNYEDHVSKDGFDKIFKLTLDGIINLEIEQQKQYIEEKVPKLEVVETITELSLGEATNNLDLETKDITIEEVQIEDLTQTSNIITNVQSENEYTTNENDLETQSSDSSLEKEILELLPLSIFYSHIPTKKEFRSNISNYEKRLESIYLETNITELKQIKKSILLIKNHLEDEYDWELVYRNFKAGIDFQDVKFNYRGELLVRYAQNSYKQFLILLESAKENLNFNENERFTKIIEEICRDNIVTDTEKDFLYEKADYFGISHDKVELYLANDFRNYPSFIVLINEICEDGIITSKERKYINEKASLYKIPTDQVDKLISIGLFKIKKFNELKINNDFKSIVIMYLIASSLDLNQNFLLHINNFISTLNGIEDDNENNLISTFKFRTVEQLCILLNDQLEYSFFEINQIDFDKKADENYLNKMLKKLGLGGVVFNFEDTKKTDYRSDKNTIDTNGLILDDFIIQDVILNKIQNSSRTLVCEFKGSEIHIDYNTKISHETLIKAIAILNIKTQNSKNKIDLLKQLNRIIDQILIKHD
jgi:hypothetical protein